MIKLRVNLNLPDSPVIIIEFQRVIPVGLLLLPPRIKNPDGQLVKWVMFHHRLASEPILPISLPRATIEVLTEKVDSLTWFTLLDDWTLYGVNRPLRIDQMPWLVTRYAKEIAVGDGVLIWIAGKEAGIDAIAEVIEPAKMLSEVPDIGYWIDRSRLGTKSQARIRFTSKLLEKPILRASLKEDPLLQSLGVIRQPNCTNYRIAPEEWKRVHELKG